MIRATILVLFFISLTFAIFPQNLRGALNQRQEAEFQTWMRAHNKIYESDSEYKLRFTKYQESAKRIHGLNFNSPDAVFAHNQFSDLSPEEFKEIYLTAKIPKRDSVEILKPLAPAPKAFDWRSKNVVTPVKDQGQCGSCWAFSATENIESVWMLSHNITVPQMKPLSPQQIVDCDNLDDGCNGGDTVTAYKYVEQAGGLEPNADYPYTGEDGNCAFKKIDVLATITGYKFATDPNNPNEGTMYQNLFNWAPLSICVDAASWQNYHGGILRGSQCGQNLDHCVQAVGYNLNNNPPYWIVRNSWGTSWGVSGYIMLEYGQNTCGLADEATSVTCPT